MSLVKKIKLKTYRDKRGELSENTFEQIISKSKHFFVSYSKPKIVRGNHYHKKKIEWFLVLKGICQVVVMDLKTKKKEELIISEKDKTIILMKPNQAHAFKNIGKEQMILLAIVNMPHDQKNPDTYNFEVIKP